MGKNAQRRRTRAHRDKGAGLAGLKRALWDLGRGMPRSLALSRKAEQLRADGVPLPNRAARRK